MNPSNESRAAILAERERLGLDYRDTPGLAISAGDEGIQQFLSQPVK